MSPSAGATNGFRRVQEPRPAQKTEDPRRMGRRERLRDHGGFSDSPDAGGERCLDSAQAGMTNDENDGQRRVRPIPCHKEKDWSDASAAAPGRWTPRKLRRHALYRVLYAA